MCEQEEVEYNLDLDQWKTPRNKKAVWACLGLELISRKGIILWLIDILGAELNSHNSHKNVAE